MELKLKQIRESFPVLQKVMNSPMDIKLAYRLKKIAKQLQAEAKGIEEARLELIKKYGEKVKDKNGKETQQIRVSPFKMEKFTKEFNSLLEETISTPVEKIPFECIESLGKITPNDLVVLDDFVEEERPSKKKMEG